MTEVVFDRVSGAFWSDDPSQVTPGDPRAITVEVPDNTAAWRLIYDVETEQVTVRYSGMTNSKAEAAMQAEVEAEAAAQALAEQEAAE